MIGLALLVTGSAAAQVKLAAKFNSAYGWVKPGESYPFFLEYSTGVAGASSVSVQVTLPPSAIYVSATPAPLSGDGASTSPLTWNLGTLAPNASGRILVRARAASTTEDPEVVWKNLSATAKVTSSLAGIPQPAITAKTMGPKVTTLPTARYGERPFPVVMVQYQDIKRCTGPGAPFPECTGNHTAEALDAAVNSRTSGKSLWQLYNDMSFGQLSPIGSVRPKVGATSTPFDPTYNHKFSTLTPGGLCTGTTLAAVKGTPLYLNRIENGWYTLPGTQGYYGADKTGHALVGALTGQGLLFGVDDACGPTGKIVYDAASLADPDLDYNDFDTDKDGVVDFFNLMFAGDGGNGNTSVTGINNVWPHKSDLRYYFTDANGETGYVSNDQLRNHEGALMYWTNATRKSMTTTNTGLPVYVRIGPYNVNPESAVEQMSVIAHEYGHSLGLPDFYSTGSRETMGTWELMAADHAQFMTVFSRQDLGWIVPVEVEDGAYTLRESKKDTGSITWKRPDGTPYTLTGEGIHNADALRVQLPKVQLIDSVPSGTRAWHSGAGNDFGCPGHTLDVFVPELEQNAGAAAISLKFKTLYEIEWDWDFAFVLASTDGGRTWKSLPSKKGTTLSNWNPNNAGCYAEYQNGITGVSGEANALTNTSRHLGSYPEAQWIDDEFDLTEFRGKSLLLRFSYFTDAAAVKRGWFIDDLSITADGHDLYRSDFESEENTRLFPGGFARISSADGLDVDHAYYIELRDRVSWDKDGKAQSERGAPTWAPGVAILYTDENHGYGNTGAEGVPAQTVVDSQPQPGNATPNLDDAAFTLTAGDTEFNGCTHIDNYVPTGADTWKLPNGLKLTVTSLSGLSPDGSSSNATATVVAKIHPDCSIVNEAPVLQLGAGQSDPDTDGSIALAWSRPAGASGPDTIQEATMLATLVEDDAENGIGQWTTTASTGTMAWETSTLKSASGAAFWGRAVEGAVNVSTSLTYAQPIAIPNAGTATLTFSDWHMNEGDDSVAVEVSEDGRLWHPIYESARSELAPDAALAFAGESLTPQTISLAAYRGKTIRLRFTMYAGAENRAGSTPMGWYVDDIRIEAANWYDVGTSSTPSFTRLGVTTGKYYYRVRTTFGSGAIGVPSPWSNIVAVQVYYQPVSPKPDLGVASVRVVTNRETTTEPASITAVIRNTGNATSAASQTMFTLDGTNILGSIETPALAPGGTAEVVMPWDPADLSNGEHTITVVADEQSTVDESNESNNDISITVTITDGRI
ncbi:MAG TPA: CARDB domain-containing protein [Thermoanaerobaculia bacterium]|nr:CARDB domain-containing protein [Thermoanaerobaculia bacterium]